MAKKAITLKMISGQEYESVNATGNKVSIDMYDGGDKKNQSPMELLLSALASCASVDAVLMMKKKRRSIGRQTRLQLYLNQSTLILGVN